MKIKGQSLRWTESDLLALSNITDAGLAISESWWKRHAFASDRNLLTAAKWSPENASFIFGVHEVSDEDIKAMILILLDDGEIELLVQTRQLIAGNITLPDWQSRFSGSITGMHVAMWAAGVGGFGRFNSTDRILAGRIILDQLRFLEHFARQLESRASTADTPSDALARTRLYARSGRKTFEEAKRKAKSEAGFLFEMNVLSPAEHCPQCPKESTKGWVPIGTLPIPGSRICMANCKCHLEYSKVLP